MTAFATNSDVSKTLNRTFTPDEQSWIDELCEQASSYLRSQIGQEITPQQQVTFTDWPDHGRVDLPQYPVVSVDAVQRDGADILYCYRPGYILVSGDDPVDVTFTFGLMQPPNELQRLTIVLVSSSLTTLELGLGVSVGGLSSIALDDFRAAFANGGTETGMTLPAPQLAAVKARYGRGDIEQVRFG